MWALLEAIDWDQTALGPRANWSTQLDSLISVTFQSQTVDSLWLGTECNMIYNKAYSALTPDHPSTFGKPAREVWAGIWDYIQPIAERCLAGLTTYKQDDYIQIATFGDGHKLEQYFTSRWVPIAHKDGQIFGLFNQATDTTERILAERRLETIREMSEQILVARTSREFYDSIVDVFNQNVKDAPFVLCYSVASQAVDGYTKAELNLESSLNVPTGHPSAPQRHTTIIGPKPRTHFGLNSDHLSSPTLSAISALSSGSGRIQHTIDETASWPIQKALSTRQCVVVQNCKSLTRGFPLCVWDELPFSAIVVPICSDNSSEIPEAVLILGLSVQLPFNEEYDNWVHVIRGQLTSSLTSVKAYEAEQKRLEDAARMERAKASWFRGAAHDLRSPLTLISGPIEDLLETNLTNSQRGQLVTAKRNTERLMRLVNALMDFSRLEAGRVTGRFVPVDLGSFVSDLANVFRPAIERMKIKFQVDIQPHDKLVYIDPALFETVVSNLIGNALKYTAEGCITVGVRYGEMAEVAVIDTGVGIPADELDQVSEWYHRATTAVHSGTQGTGLGLALAKELLRLHDGELTVSSKIADENNGQHGSVFTARIPLTARETIDAEGPTTAFGAYGKAVATEAMRWVRDNETDSSDNGRSDTHNESTLGSQSGSGSRRSEGYMFSKTDVLLLVDDNLDMRQYIKRIFSPYCEVIEASNGEEALAIATASQPDLILSDVMMPKMNGLDLLEKIRSQPETKLVPMVLLSAMTGDDARVDALLMGAEDYLEKPFKPKELLARVHLHMQVGKKRLKLEKAFTEREVQIATLSDYCPSGILRSDASGHLTYLNTAFRRIAGMDDDVDPDSWPSYCEDSVVKEISEPWFKFIAGEEKELRLTFKWRNGRTVSGLYIRLDKILPTLSGILGCVTDITHEEERLREAELRRMEAEESKHQQELLIDLTSHEIRTPVSAILQCSSLVKENLVALKEQLRLSGTLGYKPTPELLDDLDEDVEALESE
jgi:signal transduction histidine kinase/FixJ family two-component response regulator